MYKNNCLNVYYYEWNAALKIARVITKLLQGKGEIIIVCVGSNKISGDSLGAFVGTFLKKSGVPNVYGTLNKTVTPKNLIPTILEINKKHNNPFIIGVSSDLSIYEDDLECIILKDAALETELLGKLKFGNMSIKGILNTTDYECIPKMQKVDLNLVYKIAKVISKGIKLAIDNNKIIS